MENNMTRGAIGFFILVLIGSLMAALIGGLFGALIALVSPQFVKSLFALTPDDGSIIRYVFSVGLIWGLFLGVAVSCFACFLTAIVKIISLRIEHKSVKDA